tara:strand:+ start:33761 stop:34528 length:768 start_codon:yes stop_codon:yes gene_type:complete
MPLTSWYDNWNELYFLDVMSKGITIHTSGTSGTPSAIFQPVAKIQADAQHACKVQCITSKSKIYTCLNPTRAGALFAQTIPGLLVNASVDLVKFSPYDYVKAADKYTHTHLTPKQAKAVMLTKGFNTLDLTDKIFLIGSEPVTYDIIEAFIKKNAKVITIWGMTEVGVNAIMHVFNNMNDVTALKAITPKNSTVLGNIFNCDWKIDTKQRLWVNGDICVYDDWFNTKDQVVQNKGCLFYTGRDGTLVDFNNPRKG